MRIVETEVYTFDELSESAQETALDKLRDINVFYEWWDFDGLLDLSSEEMKERRITEVDTMLTYDKIWFSIDRDWYIEFVSLDINNEETFRKFLRIPKRLWEQLCIGFPAYGYRNKTTTIEFESDKESGRPFTEHEQSILDRAKDIFDAKVQEALYMLRDEYYYRLSDNAVKETIVINEYEFTETGAIW